MLIKNLPTGEGDILETGGVGKYENDTKDTNEKKISKANTMRVDTTQRS